MQSVKSHKQVLVNGDSKFHDLGNGIDMTTSFVKAPREAEITIDLHFIQRREVNNEWPAATTSRSAGREAWSGR